MFRQANFEVLFQPEFQDIGEVKVGPGEVAKLVCKVKASPDPDVVWMKVDEDGKAEEINCKADEKWQRFAVFRLQFVPFLDRRMSLPTTREFSC